MDICKLKTSSEVRGVEFVGPGLRHTKYLQATCTQLHVTHLYARQRVEPEVDGYVAPLPIA